MSWNKIVHIGEWRKAPEQAILHVTPALRIICKITGRLVIWITVLEIEFIQEGGQCTQRTKNVGGKHLLQQYHLLMSLIYRSYLSLMILDEWIFCMISETILTLSRIVICDHSLGRIVSMVQCCSRGICLNYFCFLWFTCLIDLRA